MDNTEYTLQTLVSMIRNDDVKAFEIFFKNYYKRIYSFIFRSVGETEAAKDITQDCFIRFWNYRHSLEPERFKISFLYKTAHNLVLNYIERHKSYIDITNEQLTQTICEPLIGYEHKMTCQEIASIVSKLPERCRTIFLLSKFERFSISEISEILDINNQTVKNQLQKALTFLKKYFSEK